MTGLDTLAPFALFAFVSAATPGQNNLLLLTSGLRVGLWRSIPFIVGISVGFSALLFATGYGLGQIFESFPAVQLALKVLGSIYFVALAWTLVSSQETHTAGEGRGLGFWTGVLFQAVNPKAWLMCITAIALFLPSTWTFATIAMMAGVFVVVGFSGANMAWAGAGQLLKPLIAGRVGACAFSTSAMATLLVLSILTVWIPEAMMDVSLPILLAPGLSRGRFSATASPGSATMGHRARVDGAWAQGPEFCWRWGSTNRGSWTWSALARWRNERADARHMDGRSISCVSSPRFTWVGWPGNPGGAAMSAGRYIAETPKPPFRA